MRSAPPADVVSVIDRVVLVLSSFGADDERLGVCELARRANLPKSTVSRLVSELVEQRYLERDGSGVRLGVRLFELGQLATRPNTLRALAVETMADLRDEIGQTVQLAVLDGGDTLCLGVLHARGPLRALPRVGARSLALRWAAGRVLLALSPDETVAGVVGAAHLAAREAEALREELLEIRQRGVAFDVEPHSGRIVGVAAVVRSRDGVALAAIAASGDPATFDPWSVTPALRAAVLGVERRTS